MTAEAEANGILPVVEEAPLFVDSLRKGRNKTSRPERVGAPITARRLPPAFEISRRVSYWSSHAPAHQALVKLIARERPHVFGLQETKIQDQHVDEVRRDLSGLLGDYETFWYCSGPPARKGYAGTALGVLSKGRGACPELIGVTRGIGQAEGDAEGRVITAELDVAYVVTVYTPNSGEGLRRLGFRTVGWDRAFGDYVKRLEQAKPVLVIGDLNVAHEDVDFFNPQEKRTLKQAGTTLEERASFADNLLAARQSVSPAEESREFSIQDQDSTLIDTFRFAHPSAEGVFSYWSMRAGNRRYNRGMRLDYCLASHALVLPGKETLPRLHDAFVLDADTVGVSDHCPVGCILRL